MKKFFAFLILAVWAAGAVSAKDAYEELNRLYSAKQFGPLESACQARLKEKPKSLDAYYFLAMAQMAQGKADQAVPYMMNFEKYHGELEKAESQKEGKAYALADPYYMDLYFLLGEYYVRKQQYEKALAWLVKAKGKYATDPMLQFFRGRCYAGLQDYGNALKAFQKESELDPKEPSAFYNAATCYARQGKAEMAVEWLKKAIALYPQYKDEVRKDPGFEKIKGSRAFQKLTGQ